MHPLKDPRFQCISPLGQGSYGKVYQAYDTLLNRVIAIKCLTDPQSEEMAALCLLAGKKHAGLVEIYDVFTDDDQICILMDHVPGANLAMYCARQGRLSRKEARIFLKEVLELLCFLHQDLGIVYNDLKPENIMRQPDGHYRLIDFGSCFLIADPPLRRYGSPAYASPEYVRGDRVDGRSDLYSLGKTAKAVLDERAIRYYQPFLNPCLSPFAKARYASAEQALRQLRIYRARRLVGTGIPVFLMIGLVIMLVLAPVFYQLCLEQGWYVQAISLFPDRLEAYASLYDHYPEESLYQLSYLPIERLDTMEGKAFVLNYVTTCMERKLPLIDRLSEKCADSAWAGILNAKTKKDFDDAFRQLLNQYEASVWQPFIQAYWLEVADQTTVTWLLDGLVEQEEDSQAFRQDIYAKLDHPVLLRTCFHYEPSLELKADLAIRLFQTGAFQEGWLHQALQLTDEPHKRQELEMLILQWGELA